MKLVRFGAAGAEKPGLVDAKGAIRDLSGHVKDINGDSLAPANLAKLAKIDPASLPEAPKGVRIGPCVNPATSSPSVSTTPTTPPKPAHRSPPSRSCSTSSPTASSAPTTTS
jgi:hypothetical protein